LAKFYQHHHHHPDQHIPQSIEFPSWIQQQQQQQQQQPALPRLNDVVECVGYVSVSSSMDGDDDVVDTDCSSIRMHENLFGLGSSGELSLPPSSRLPRLHVLYYRTLNVNDLFTDDNDENDTPANIPSPWQVWTDHQPVVDNETTTIRVMEQEDYSTIDNPTLSMEDAGWQALLLTLLSQAERKPSHQNHLSQEGGGGRGEIQRTTETLSSAFSSQALGCISLQLQTMSNESSLQVFDQLLTFLRTICPGIVASVDLVNQHNHNTIGSSMTILRGPDKSSGRLLPNPWQLPKGSTLVIRHDPNNNNNNNFKTDELLDELLQQHRISYTFEGGMTIPFEADYRIIVVTMKPTTADALSATSPLLPSTLCWTINEDNKDLFATGSLLETFRIKALKQALSRARSLGNIILPRAVLEQAEHDFIYRRGHGVRGTHHDEPGRRGPRIPQEHDLHRWLTMTRLFARARASGEATVADWKSALELDDAMTSERPS
jgi:Mini-chromosome maintenance replisome factor